jgi:excisionase family DNA binding protein
MKSEDLLTVREIAGHLKLTTECVRRWITNLPPGTNLPATQYGQNSRYLVKASDLEAWLARR